MSSKRIFEECSAGGTAAHFALLGMAAAVFVVCTPAVARDNGQFTNVSPAVRTWFHDVKSPSGVPCCDIADGHRTDFQMRKNQYWVPINGTWMPVPPQAVINNSGNPVGDAVVWYSIYSGQVVIRCFVPGSGA
jgi:hypothetical protein